MIQAVWDKQSQWSQAADDLKDRVTTARDFVLTFTIVGAVLSTAGAGVGLDTTTGQVLVYLAAVVAAGSAIATAFAGKENSEPWTRARSVAEAIKSEAFTYLAQAGDYAAATRDDRLAEQVARLEEGAADLYVRVTAFKPKQRVPPVVTDAGTYATERVKQQVEGYYLPKARELDGWIRRARLLVVVLGAIGSAFAVAAGKFELSGLAVWVPVVTSITSAITAHVAAERWDLLRLEYSRTALQLSHLLSSFERDKLQPGEFVVGCETVITAQNKAWLAKLAEPPK
ncbi:DUF4231 domain-containing protein [Solirubrobacter ginsenosidimutans]|uniref:DUF4231 domain-containing protein n=1 Tax=Solirubrobacter ginsenosidimutans TaxID=490573 RepID=A0A9X3MPV9_9ACTN|nr:DUF4231 domain-containing protein [Solirubrobacter ginsenosidimutans]MDA0160224.1 DUF4231 domain-containing protein [Solirubrobacter ginsenosidimutans]